MNFFSFLIILLLISLGNASYKNTDMEFIHQKGLPHDVFETLLEKFVTEIKGLDWSSFDTGPPKIKYEDIFSSDCWYCPHSDSDKDHISHIRALFEQDFHQFKEVTFIGPERTANIKNQYFLIQGILKTDAENFYLFGFQCHYAEGKVVMLSIYWIHIDKTTDYLWRTGSDFQLLEVDWNAARKGDFDDLKRQSYRLLPTEKKLDSFGGCAQEQCKFNHAKVIKTVADMMAFHDRNINYINTHQHLL